MTKIAFIGAGSVVFTRDLIAQLARDSDLDKLTLALHDIDSERLATAGGIAASLNERAGNRLMITTSIDRRAALTGADFVINMIQVGGIDATRSDFTIPQRYGLRQTIGDTIGVGGIFRGLRTFPVLDSLAIDIRDCCPEAWLLNYTNPMSMNLWYLTEAHPEVKSVGLCHSVYWTVVQLCNTIGVPYEDVRYTAAGVNHQSWLLRWARDDEDLYPLLDAKIASDKQLLRRARVDIYRRLGYYPTESSEHSAEYVPWYLRHDAEIDRLRLEVGAYLRVSEGNVAEYAETRRRLSLGEPVQASVQSSEYAPEVIHSMITDTPREIYATVRNANLISNLPMGAAVEVPVIVNAQGVTPVAIGALPRQCAALNRAFLNPVELTVAAAITGDPRMVRQALMLDPNAASTLTVEQIWDLCDDLVTAHGALLPEPLRERCAP